MPSRGILLQLLIMAGSIASLLLKSTPDYGYWATIAIASVILISSALAIVVFNEQEAALNNLEVKTKEILGSSTLTPAIERRTKYRIMKVMHYEGVHANCPSNGENAIFGIYRTADDANSFRRPIKIVLLQKHELNLFATYSEKELPQKWRDFGAERIESVQSAPGLFAEEIGAIATLMSQKRHFEEVALTIKVTGSRVPTEVAASNSASDPDLIVDGPTMWKWSRLARADRHLFVAQLASTALDRHMARNPVKVRPDEKPTPAVVNFSYSNWDAFRGEPPR